MKISAKVSHDQEFEKFNIYHINSSIHFFILPVSVSLEDMGGIETFRVPANTMIMGMQLSG